MSGKRLGRPGLTAVAYQFIVAPPESDTEIRCRWCYVMFKGARAFDLHICEEQGEEAGA